jgi:hypothetical protein
VLMKHDSGEKYLGFGVRILFDWDKEFTSWDMQLLREESVE